MLRAAELLRHRQLDFDFLGFAEVVARDLVAGVGKGFPELVAEGKIHTGEAGFLLELALRAGELVFSGLDDFAHFGNFQKAIAEHEVVTWDGHSMLGASDFWARPQYPSFYQIFLYGGCLGYEYYVKPILHGHGDSWAKLDIMSSVVEVSATANEFAGPAIAKLIYGIQYGGRSSWRNILLNVRNAVGDSTFGVSGVRDNCFTPSGTRCM